MRHLRMFFSIVGLIIIAIVTLFIFSRSENPLSAHETLSQGNILRDVTQAQACSIPYASDYKEPAAPSCPIGYELITQFGDGCHGDESTSLLRRLTGPISRNHEFTLSQQSNLSMGIKVKEGHPEAGCFPPGNGGTDPLCTQIQNHENFTISLNGTEIGEYRDEAHQDAENAWFDYDLNPFSSPAGTHTLTFNHTLEGNTEESVNYKVSLCTCAVPESFEFISPYGSGDDIGQSVKPKLDWIWTQKANVARYRVKISPAGAGGKAIFNQVFVPAEICDGTQCSLQQQLENADITFDQQREYKFRVIAINDCLSGKKLKSSIEKNFQIGNKTISASEPDDDAEIGGVTPLFKWSNSFWYERYKLHIAFDLDDDGTPEREFVADVPMSKQNGGFCDQFRGAKADDNICQINIMDCWFVDNNQSFKLSEIGTYTWYVQGCEKGKKGCKGRTSTTMKFSTASEASLNWPKGSQRIYCLRPSWDSPTQ